jgi:cobalt-zinc-cadmium efflux system outer membrane protein
MKRTSFVKRRGPSVAATMIKTLAIVAMAWTPMRCETQEAALPGGTPRAAANTATNGEVRALEGLVAEALAQNPELKFYEAEMAAAKAGGKVAAVLANPELSASVGQKRVSGGGLSAEGVAWSVALVQPFEWPGRLGLRKAIANQDRELAQLGYDRFKVALAGRVRTLGFGLFAAQEKSAAAAEVAERFRALREVLVQRDPAGLTPLLETRIIEATELNAQRKATEALLATQSARLELNHLRGANPLARLEVIAAAVEFRPVPDWEALLRLARTNNFELRVRAVELAQQGFRLDLAKKERYPTLSVGPTYTEEQAGRERERILGVSLSLPLPIWNRNKGHIDVASARQLQAEVSLQMAERDLLRQVIEAAFTYDTKMREMNRWRPDSVQHFKEAAELADRHYRLGAVPIATYVELQQQYLEAVEGLLDTRKEALAAAARLELLTGLPSSLTPLRQGDPEEKP